MMNPPVVNPAAAPVAIVGRDALTDAVAKAKLVIERAATVPILNNVRLVAEAGKLAVVATDLDMELCVTLQGEVDVRFDTTVPVDLLLSMCRRAPKAERVVLTLGTTETGEDDPVYDIAILTFGKGTFTINALPPAEYPPFDDFPGKTHQFRVPGSTFWNALDAVRGAVSTEETRYYLNGVYLYRAPDALRTVATDGHRLYCQDMLPPDGSEKVPGVIVPRKMVEILHRLMKGKGAPAGAAICVDEQFFAIGWGDLLIRTKLIDGTFPDYGRVLPTGNDNVVTFDSAKLVEAIEAATVVSGERGRAVRAEIGATECTLSVRNPDAGSTAVMVDCAHDGPDITVGFNASHLLQAIQTACPAGGDITLKMADAESPVLLTGEEHGWTGCLMPMRA